MTTTAPAPIRMQRNEDYQEVWTITDGEATAELPHGQPLDLTSMTFAGAIKAAAGVATVILALDPKTNVTTTGIHINAPATDGQITVTVKHADMAAAALGNVQGVVELAYDVLMTDANGIVKCIAEGPFSYQPAVT